MADPDAGDSVGAGRADEARGRRSADAGAGRTLPADAVDVASAINDIKDELRRVVEEFSSIKEQVAGADGALNAQLAQRLRYVTEATSGIASAADAASSSAEHGLARGDDFAARTDGDDGDGGEGYDLHYDPFGLQSAPEDMTRDAAARRAHAQPEDDELAWAEAERKGSVGGLRRRRGGGSRAGVDVDRGGSEGGVTLDADDEGEGFGFGDDDGDDGHGRRVIDPAGRAGAVGPSVRTVYRAPTRRSGGRNVDSAGDDGADVHARAREFPEALFRDDAPYGDSDEDWSDDEGLEGKLDEGVGGGDAATHDDANIANPGGGAHRGSHSHSGSGDGGGLGHDPFDPDDPMDFRGDYLDAEARLRLASARAMADEEEGWFALCRAYTMIALVLTVLVCVVQHSVFGQTPFVMHIPAVRDAVVFMVRTGAGGLSGSHDLWRNRFGPGNDDAGGGDEGREEAGYYGEYGDYQGGYEYEYDE